MGTTVDDSVIIIIIIIVVVVASSTCAASNVFHAVAPPVQLSCLLTNFQFHCLHIERNDDVTVFLMTTNLLEISGGIICRNRL
jgi:hypothetical protein